MHKDTYWKPLMSKWVFQMLFYSPTRMQRNIFIIIIIFKLLCFILLLTRRLETSWWSVHTKRRVCWSWKTEKWGNNDHSCPSNKQINLTYFTPQNMSSLKYFRSYVAACDGRIGSDTWDNTVVASLLSALVSSAELSALCKNIKDYVHTWIGLDTILTITFFF